MADYTIGVVETQDYTSVDAFIGDVIDGDVGTIMDASDLLTAQISVDLNYTLKADAAVKFTAPTKSAAEAGARLELATGRVIEVHTSSTVIIEDLAIISAGGSIGKVEVGSGSTLTLDSCIILSDGTNARCVANWGGTVKVYNSIGILVSGYGAVFYNNSGTFDVYHCSALDLTSAHEGMFDEAGGTLTVYASIGQETVSTFSDVFTGTPAGDYNVAEDASGPGANAFDTESGVFENQSSSAWDLSIAAADQGNFDVPDYSGVDSRLATDIMGTARDGATIDAGCWQTPAVAGGFPTSVLRRAFHTHLRR